MKLSTLYESQVDGAALRTEFKKIAASCDLSFTHGMNWPQASAGGVWFSFVLAPKGGEHSERVVGDERLPLDLRIKAAIVKLAKFLEDLAAKGHAIKVVKGGRRDLKAPNVQPGTIKDELKKNLVWMAVPGSNTGNPGNGLTFFIGNKDGRKEKLLVIRLGENKTFRLFCQDDAEELKKLNREFVTFGKQSKFNGYTEETVFLGLHDGYAYGPNKSVNYVDHPEPVCKWIDDLCHQVYDYIKGRGYDFTPYPHNWRHQKIGGDFGREIRVELNPPDASKAVQPDIIYITLDEAKHVMDMIQQAASAANSKERA